jgi:hypothetical protein
MTTNFDPSLLFWIQDPGWLKIRIRDLGSGIWVRDKHPGSATLLNSLLLYSLSCMWKVRNQSCSITGKKVEN